MDAISDEQIVKDFEEKFLGYYRCAREAAPYMKQASWGRIVNLSGGAGRTPGTAISTPARNISCVALTKSLAKHARSLRHQRQRHLPRHDYHRSGVGASPRAGETLGQDPRSLSRRIAAA
jgi:NAD(P)-dependent dehydrogenase (short-subunit alcohol dehydrogenase family)